MKSKGALIGTFILNFIFALFQVAEYRLSKDPSYSWTGVRVLSLAAISVVIALGISIVLAFCVNRFGDRTVKAKATEGHSFEKIARLGVLWPIFFVSYIPMFLIFYPGICAYDSYIQIHQCITGELIDHHPFLHTLIIKAFYSFGKAIGNINLGMALFVLLQMLVLSASFALCISLIFKNGGPRKGIIGLILFFLLYPYHVFMAISITKAALFTAAFVILGVLLCLTIIEKRDSIRLNTYDIWIAVLVFPTMAFRTNARYALMLLCVFLVFFAAFSKENRRSYARALISVGLGLILSLTIITALYKALGVTQADRREMLSIPIQQLARTAYYHSEELTDEEMADINGFILNEAWKDYEPALADPVKRNVNTSHILEHKSSMIHTYLHLLSKYPGEYVNAVLAVDSGYLYPADQSCLTVYGDTFGLGFVQTAWSDYMFEFGASKSSSWPGAAEKIEAILSDNTVQKIPVVRLFLLPGIVLWGYLYLGLWSIIKKRNDVVCVVLLALAYIGTLLLGPTVQLRYIYPALALLPMCIVMAAISKNLNEH